MLLATRSASKASLATLDCGAQIVPAAGQLNDEKGSDLDSDSGAEQAATKRAAPVPIGNVASLSSDAQLVVKDPKASRCCYDVLGVQRTATPDEVKKAYRSRARTAHPDKPGGSHEAFLCLEESFQVICDSQEREAYDCDLIANHSQDGLSCSVVNSDAGGSEDVACPEMVLDMFLSITSEFWPDLFDALTRENLIGLAKHLEGTGTVPHPAPEATKKGPLQSTKGIDTKGGKYNGKINFHGVTVRTWKTGNLDEAIDGRAALTQLSSRVRSQILAGITLEDALRTACKEVRSADQAAAFVMDFAFEMPSSKSKKRPTTPAQRNLETMLKQRKTLLDLCADGTAAAQAAMLRAHKQMIRQRESERKDLKAQSPTIQKKLLTMVRRKTIPVGVPYNELRQFRVLATTKLGILKEPCIDSDLMGYTWPGSIFDSVQLAVNAVTGRKFWGGPDGSGWLPEFSRKKGSKRVLEEVLKMIDDKSASGSSSSSSSSLQKNAD